MEVRFYNHADAPGKEGRPLMIWRDSSQAPAKDDYVVIPGRGLTKKTWVVRYKVWRPKADELRVDVFCGPWEFDM